MANNLISRGLFTEYPIEEISLLRPLKVAVVDSGAAVAVAVVQIASHKGCSNLAGAAAAAAAAAGGSAHC